MTTVDSTNLKYEITYTTDCTSTSSYPWRSIQGEHNLEIFVPNCSGEVKEMAKKEMALWKVYGVNRRTGQYMEKTVLGPANDEKAVLNGMILEHAEEIRNLLGRDARDIVYDLFICVEFDPVEEDD